MKKYRVLGAHAVLGHQPNEVFEAVIDRHQEARLIERGSLKEIPVHKPTEKETN